MIISRWEGHYVPLERIEGLSYLAQKKFMSLQSEYDKIDFELIEGYPAIHNDHKCSQLEERLEQI